MARAKSRQQEAEALARSIRSGDLASARKLLSQHARGKAPEAARPAGDHARPLTLHEACGGKELYLTTPAGPAICYVLRHGPPDTAQQERRAAREYAAVLRGAGQQFDELTASPGLCHAADARPEDLLLIHAEVLGSDAMIFLIGLLSFREGQFASEQLLARREGEEVAILQAFADRRDAAGVLVTFGRRAGELKRIQKRCDLYGVEPPFRSPPHLDLRAEVRKRWHKRLRSVGLEAVRRQLVQRRTAPAPPAPNAAEAYRRLTQTGDAAGMPDVLARNRLDLLTMAQLVCLLLTGHDPLTE